MMVESLHTHERVEWWPNPASMRGSLTGHRNLKGPALNKATTPKPTQRKFSKSFLILVKVWSEPVYSSIHTLVSSMIHPSCFPSRLDLNESVPRLSTAARFSEIPKVPTRSNKLLDFPRRLASTFADLPEARTARLGDFQCTNQFAKEGFYKEHLKLGYRRVLEL